ncbi:dihydrofolate reductase family protein [Brevibacillus panacihumi]|uniref:dihydrofolate reductase family protein n=1 Tax=Brevibacillus panacihumi TaxID=497735 RepID=UPI003D0876D9
MIKCRHKRACNGTCNLDDECARKPGRRVSRMAKIVFALNQSLDGFVDHDHTAFQPDPVLFRHFIDDVRGLAGCLYGRRMYETMRYWDGDHFEWDAPEREYAAAWQSKPKWVVSRTLKSVGPNASLIEGDLAAAIRGLKAQHEGEIEVAGPELAHSLTELGLVDEYRLYLHPVVLGHGKPFFAGPRPPLRLVASDRIGEKVIRLTYVPA